MLWREPGPQSAWLRRIVRTGRVLRKIIQEMLVGDLPLYAMSLVYTTLLSIVPVLAVSFSVLKAFGVHNQLEPLLLSVLAPLGESASQITANVIGFVDNIKVGVLGALGTGLLVYTVISLMQKIESAFNRIWHVTDHRSFSRRFSDYLSVILIGPVLVFAALGITGSVMSSDLMQWVVAHEPAKTVVEIVARLVPYVLVIAAFTFVYKLVPYTRVSMGAALVGGVVAGVLWESAGLVFASFIASSTKYTAIYSGFAILIVAMIWLYLSWLILLIGASIAFYYQHPEHVVLDESRPVLSGAARERAALLVMMLIGRSHLGSDGVKPVTVDSLVEAMRLPGNELQELLDALHDARLLARTDDDPPGWLPARSIEKIPVKVVLDAARGNGQAGMRVSGQDVDTVADVLERIDRSVSDALATMTIKDLVGTGDEA